MELIHIDGNTLTFRNKEHLLIGCKPVDEASFFLVTDKGHINFFYTSTKINSVDINSFDDVLAYTTEIVPTLELNWLGLEQELRYSPLFAKAFSEASDKGFSLFTVTLINGKSGVASQNALSFAFQMLGVTWTDEEKQTLNAILTRNNFTIQI